MKAVTVFVLLLLGIASLSVALADAETKTNLLYAKISRARTSNDVQTIIQSLPEIEKLWPDQAESYFRLAKESAEVLEGASNRPGATTALSILWTNLIQKPLPSDEGQATKCLALKRETALCFFRVNDFSNDKSWWEDFAKFIGGIRSRIIPNYRNQAYMLSVVFQGPDGKKQMQKLVEDRNKKEITDCLQRELRSTDSRLMFHLVHSIPEPLRTDAQFIESASASAHLTAEEVNQLKTGN